MTKENPLDLDALIESVGDARLNPRFVRFLIAERILPSPAGSRTRPDYGEEHIRRCRAYFFLRDHGFSVEQIRLLAADEAEGVYPIQIAPGVVLHLDAKQSTGPPDVEVIAQVIHAALDHVSSFHPTRLKDHGNAA